MVVATLRPRGGGAEVFTMIKLLAVAGIGGTLPTLCRLAATYSVNPATQMPEVGLFVGLALFFLIGMAVQYGFEEQSGRLL